jgi:predicted P-loop ATPase
MIILRNWIVEIAELKGLKDADVQAQRSMLSGSEDQFRAPYGTSPITYKRRCVFVGTANGDAILNDPEGSRRFFVLDILPGGVDLKALTEVVPYIWGEALRAYESGEQWWLTAEQQARVSAQNEGFTKPDTHSDAVTAYFLAMEASKRPAWIGTAQLLSDLERVAGVKISANDPSFADSLKRAGFKTVRRYHDGVRLHGYALPANLKGAATLKRGDTPRDLSLVPEVAEVK